MSDELSVNLSAASVNVPKVRTPLVGQDWMASGESMSCGLP